MSTASVNTLPQPPPPRPGVESAVVVMPRGTSAWAGAEALWITAREWARAAQRRFGAAWIATPDGTWAPDGLPERGGGDVRRRPYPLPAVMRTLLKDVRLGVSQSRFEVGLDGPWRGTAVRLVWEHHDLFSRAGERLARAHGAPLVRYVHAPQVWEARKWGVRRPLWGRALERRERRHLRAADLVACVSVAVRDRLTGMGVDPERVLVSPMGVDARRFSPEVDAGPARERYGIAGDEVVVGWCGSFRPFHGLDALLDAFTRVTRGLDRAEGAGPHGGPPLRVRLLLVGDGPLRSRLEEEASNRGIAERVVFTGVVPHAEMPAHLGAMDVAVVSSAGTGGFHYSPLKVREYAACGRPVVAPDEGELSALGSAGFVDLYRPGDAEDLARALARLIGEPGRRREHGKRARSFAVGRWTWEARLDDVVQACERLALGAGGRDRR